MKYLIATIKGRDIEYNRTYNRLIELGVSKDQIIIDYGYLHSDVPHLKKDFHLLLYKFLNNIIPTMIKLNEDLVYLEDNIYPLEKVEDIDINKNNINWLGFIFNHKDYICGNKYVYFPLEVLVDINKNKDKIKNQHFDRFIKNYAEKNNILTLNKNYIKLYRSVSCWGSDIQKERKQKLKEKLFID